VTDKKTKSFQRSVRSAKPCWEKRGERVVKQDGGKVGGEGESTFGKRMGLGYRAKKGGSCRLSGHRTGVRLGVRGAKSICQVTLCLGITESKGLCFQTAYETRGIRKEL